MKSKKHHPQSTHRPSHVNYRSRDGQFEVVTSTAQWAHPKHDYQLVTLRLRPKFATRIQRLRDGSDGLDVMLTHVEIAKFLHAINRVDGKAKYRWRPVPEKDPQRKAQWQQINDDRYAN